MIFIIFIPVLFSSFLNTLAIHIIGKFFYASEIAFTLSSFGKTIYLLYMTNIKSLWMLLIVAALLVDIYFYALKGYRHSGLMFYLFKIIFVFLALFFLTDTFFQQEFINAFNLIEVVDLNNYILSSLFIISTLACIPIIWSVHELHRCWILPQYLQKLKIKE